MGLWLPHKPWGGPPPHSHRVAQPLAETAVHTFLSAFRLEISLGQDNPTGVSPPGAHRYKQE